MPNLLEKPTTLEDAPREVSRIRPIVTDPIRDAARSAQQDVSKTSERKPLRHRIELLLREVFEGREEFLGWTPD